MKRQAYLKNQKPLKVWAGQKWRHKVQNMECFVKKVDKEKVFWIYRFESEDHVYPLISFLEDFEWVESDENHE
jgi:hypothetical protein